MRICTDCGSVMFNGYVIDGGWKYYCSDECLHKHYTEDEWEELYGDGDTEHYWTEWEDKREWKEHMYEVAYELGQIARENGKTNDVKLDEELKLVIDEVTEKANEVRRVKDEWKIGWYDKDIELQGKNPNCECDNEDSRFYQNHGCCQWCFYVGEEIQSEVLEGEKVMEDKVIYKVYESELIGWLENLGIEPNKKRLEVAQEIVYDVFASMDNEVEDMLHQCKDEILSYDDFKEYNKEDKEK